MPPACVPRGFDAAVKEPKQLCPELKYALLNRPRLNAVFHGSCSQCVVVHAPGGFGKSSLISQAATLLDSGAAQHWISLDEADAQPQTLVRTLLGCVNADLDGLGLKDNNDLFGRAASHRIWASFAGREARSVIVLDDYQYAESAAVDALLGHLLQRMPPTIRMVIAGRRLPSIPLAKLKAENRLTILGPEELKFDTLEMSQCLAGLVDAGGIQLIDKMIRGWPALVQLVRQQVHAFPGPLTGRDLLELSWPDIANYVTTEIIDELPEELREFLIETAHLQELDSDVANAVCGIEHADRLLELLAKACPLLQRSRSSKRITHHPIIARFLREKLALRGRRYEVVRHRRAATWLMANQEIAAAGRHLVAAGAMDDVARLIEDRGAFRISLVNGFPALAELLDLLPPSVIARYPRLRVAQSWASAKVGNIRDARLWSGDAALLDGASPGDDAVRAETLFVAKMVWAAYEEHCFGIDAVSEMERLSISISKDDPSLQGWIRNILCILHCRRGDLGKAEEEAFRAIASYRMGGSLYGETFMHFHLALIYVMSGQFDLATSRAENASTLTREEFPGDSGLLAMIDSLRGHIAFERGDIETAKNFLKPAMREMIHAEALVEVHALGLTSLAKIFHRENQAEAVTACLDQMRITGADKGLRRLTWLAAHCRYELLIMNGQFSEANTLAVEEDLGLDKHSAGIATWFERERCALSRLRGLVRCADSPDTAEQIVTFIDEVRSLGRHRAAVEGMVLLARLHQAAGRSDAAITVLSEALTIAVLRSMAGVFVMEGEAIAPLLKALLGRGGIISLSPTMLSFIMRILAVIKGVPFGAGGASTIFSEREREVLALLIADHSNKMMARRLSVSEATVKFHLANIYKKLGVNTRYDAKSLARERILVPEMPM